MADRPVKWIPKKIGTTVEYRSGQTPKAEELNSWFNLLIDQGDWNADRITDMLNEEAERMALSEEALSTILSHIEEARLVHEEIGGFYSGATQTLDDVAAIEALRQAVEATRVTAESQRQANTATAIQNAELATANAVTATTNAVTATADAELATANANLATANAITATADTESATANTVIATGEAESATSEAKVATTNAVTATTNAVTATADAELATANANLATANAITATADTESATSEAVTATTNADVAAAEANDAAANAIDVAQNLETTYAPRLTDVEDEINLVSGEVTSLGDSFDSHKLDYANLVGEVSQIKRVIGINTIDSWRAVQEIVRQGKASEYFNAGDQLIANYNGTPYTWDVIGINHDIPTDTNHVHSLTIQAHDCIMNCQFDAPEALYYAEEGLAAGQQIFTQDGDNIQYKLTTTKPIPPGGQIDIYSWGDPYLPLKARTYGSDKITLIEDNIDVTTVSGENTLPEVNVRARCRYGSSNYVESNIREWLNTEGLYNWNPSTKYDRPSTGAPYTGDGFISNLDPELAKVIGKVDKQVARNNITDGGGQDTFSDKVFLASRVEAGFGTEAVTTGEKVYDWYKDISGTERIKYLNSTARYWWLRSPSPGGTDIPRNVGASGVLSSCGARNAGGLAPACCIV